MRIYLDANILFSAGKADSAVREFVHYLHQSSELVTSSYALSEARRNLILKKPEWLPYFEETNQLVGIKEDMPAPHDLPVNQKDAPILAAAIRAKCTHLLTGDHQGFGHLFQTEVQGVTIVNYAQLVSILQRKT